MLYTKFPNYFADAESDFNSSDFIIFGVPYDRTSSFRLGSAKAPYDIRQASWNFESFDIRKKVDFKKLKIHDYGDLKVENLNSEQMLKMVTEISSKILDNNKIPIAIGGEHSITPGIVKAFPKDIAVLSLDAHLDFRNEYENNINNHACSIRRISDYIPVENIAILGVRSAEKEEYDRANKLGLFYRDIFEIRSKGLQNIIKETKKYFGKKKVYFTLDIDAIDPAYAPGTSTPEPFGFTPFDVLEIINAFSKQFIGFDVVEVCPSYDHGQTAILAGRLLRSILI